MFARFGERALEPELMDDVTAGGTERRRAYRHLRRINRLFGAAGPVVYGVRRLWQEAGKPERLLVLDIGAGSGDVNRRLLRWAARHRIRMNIVLVDIAKEAFEEAKTLYGREKRVRFMQGDLFRLPERCADIVTATQFAHHFASAELPGVVRHMLRASRYGVVINDIHRHWAAWSAVWLATRCLSRNRYIRHDGPLSVAKGFRREDWLRLGNDLAECELRYWWKPMFRYVAIVRRKETAEPGRRGSGGAKNDGTDV